MEKIEVAIADDNERMIHMLGSMIESDNELELVGQADKRRRADSHGADQQR